MIQPHNIVVRHSQPPGNVQAREHLRATSVTAQSHCHDVVGIRRCGASLLGEVLRERNQQDNRYAYHHAYNRAPAGSVDLIHSPLHSEPAYQNPDRGEHEKADDGAEFHARGLVSSQITFLNSVSSSSDMRVPSFAFLGSVLFFGNAPKILGRHAA